MKIGQRVTTDEIVENLQKGMPTIIEFDNHWILATGYRKGDTLENDQILFADSCCNATMIARSVIDSMWQEGHRCRGNAGYCIVAIPVN